MTVSETLQSIMLICFGASWPFQVYSTYRAKTAKAKSFPFLVLLILGYICGAISNQLTDDRTPFLLFLYLLNGSMVTIDLILSLYYRSQESEAQKILEDAADDTLPPMD